MKIAIINDLLGGGSNGTFVVTYNLLKHLKKQGHEAFVICPDQRKIGDSDYFVLPELHLGAAIDRYVKKVGVTLSKCSRATLAKALEGVDYIHCITPFKLAIYAADYAKRHGIPISAGFHVMAENITAYLGGYKCRALNAHIYRHFYNKLYSKVDGIHYPTSFIRYHFELCVGKSTPGYVISNGANEIFAKADVERPEAAKGKYIITSTGRYSREKAQEVLIKAVSKSKHESEIQLVFAGQGAREKRYKKISRGLTNPPVFKVFTREEMAKLLNCTDIYVHPARIELEGIACLEAMKCGVPTVVSDSPLSATYDFAVDDACLFENEDSEQLARKLDDLLDNKELREKIVQKTLAKNIGYVDECMRQMDKMILKIANSKA